MNGDLRVIAYVFCGCKLIPFNLTLKLKFLLGKFVASFLYLNYGSVELSSLLKRVFLSALIVPSLFLDFLQE
jgi:hypothetical protein